MTTDNLPPRLLPFGVNIGGRSLPVHLYPEIPHGARPATAADLRTGRHVIYRVELNPDPDYPYMSTFATGDSIPALASKIRRRSGVWVTS